MNILNWNCRGLGHLRAVPALKDLVRTQKPDILFLFETRVNANKIEEVKLKIGFDSCLATDRLGSGGGVAVFWKRSLSCVVTNFASNYINLEITESSKGSWRLTGFYGYPERHRRRESWALLSDLANLSNLSWCIIGDFNDILSSDDKCGRVDHPQWLLSGFREAVSDCSLTDIYLEGYSFTWFKSKGSESAVEERLDRAMVTEDWLQLFPDAHLHNLLAPISDHNLILLTLEDSVVHKFQYSFKFENAWLVEPSLVDVVRN